MTFETLRSFLMYEMRMSHIYQPVMIKRLLEMSGTSTDLDIAKTLVMYDPSQVEYYQNITNNMVGRVLRNRNVVSKSEREYHLNGFSELSLPEIEAIKKLCDEKIEGYIKKRGDAIWNHRRVNRNAISGTVRYEVLKRAQFRCELCGVSAQEKALEVDHIVPVSQKGDNSIHNYQALCYTCNASKRDRDDADFREASRQYNCRAEGCAFCQMDDKRVLAENHLAYLVLDLYPVTHGHSLVIPKRHFADYFQISQPEINAVNVLMQDARKTLSKNDNSIAGFNIGINSGVVAGQTINHAHVHLIPRRLNDVAQPRGGVRHVIPGMADY